MSREANIFRQAQGYDPAKLAPDLPDLTGAAQYVPRLDWRAYFEAFKAAHGEPLELNGRLLFPDGWTYSKTDYAGPEWPPPSDPLILNFLQRAYWTRYLEVAEAQVKYLTREYEGLREQQAQRRLPLMQSIIVTSDGPDGKARQVSSVQELDLGMLQARISGLKEDVANALQQLVALKQESPGQEPASHALH